VSPTDRDETRSTADRVTRGLAAIAFVLLAGCLVLRLIEDASP
jgi:hypothetical protein